MGHQSFQISDFGLFSPYKMPKNEPSGDQPTAQRLHRRMILIFPCDSRRSKGVPSGSGAFIRFLVGELGTPKLAQIFACFKWLYLYNAKPIIERALRKSHINAATKLKLYSYIGIGKYLGCVQIFPLGGVRGAQGPYCKFGTTIISETTRARKLKLKT